MSQKHWYHNITNNCPSDEDIIDCDAATLQSNFNKNMESVTEGRDFLDEIEDLIEEEESFGPLTVNAPLDNDGNVYVGEKLFTEMCEAWLDTHGTEVLESVLNSRKITSTKNRTYSKKKASKK